MNKESSELMYEGFLAMFICVLKFLCLNLLVCPMFDTQEILNTKVLQQDFTQEVYLNTHEHDFEEGFKILRLDNGSQKLNPPIFLFKSFASFLQYI